MCGLYLTSNNNNLHCLQEANKVRGKHCTVVQHEYNGASFWIGHCLQSTNTSQQHEHPACSMGSLLWHNGLLKNNWLSNFGNPKELWDTQVLSDFIQDGNYEKLSDVEGSFACVNITMNHVGDVDGLYYFRNDKSPLYYGFNDGFNLSSVKTELTPHKVIDGVVFSVYNESGNVSIKPISTFTIKDDLY